MRNSTGMRIPVILALLVFVMDVSVAAGALVPTPEQQSHDVSEDFDDADFPPLMCGDSVCPDKDRSPGFPPSGAGWPVEEPGWWFGYWYDMDSNGMDDRLQKIIAGQRVSVSTTSITGADGFPTVAIVVDYSWHPGSDDIDAIKQVLFNHGWQEEGSWFDPLGILDSIVIDHVPVSSLIDIWLLDGVVMIEEQNVIVPL